MHLDNSIKRKVCKNGIFSCVDSVYKQNYNCVKEKWHNYFVSIMEWTEGYRCV